jgi:cell wall-associated NlpC family hydrolase
MLGKGVAVATALILAVTSVVGYLLYSRGDTRAEFRTVVAVPPPPSPAPSAPVSPSPTGAITFERATGPDRTVVHDGAGRTVATFTDGARTVVLTGPKRVFSEPKNTDASVTGTAWVRLAPQEWRADAADADWVRPWLARELADTSPDVLAVSMEYLTGTGAHTDAKGVRYAGDASFGPVSDTDPDGRAENSDFYDYLGVSWNFPDTGPEKPKRDRYGAVDCSGFVRLVYGYRMGYPLRNSNTRGGGLPRRAFAMSEFGPGVPVIPNAGRPPADRTALQPGDLVFFNSDPGTSTFRTDHSGIFLGVDGAGHYRFVSSRSKANGPTFGDTGGAAILDGGGYWGQRWRTARRI